jgi:hypothetical protein
VAKAIGIQKPDQGEASALNQSKLISKKKLKKVQTMEELKELRFAEMSANGERRGSVID